VGAGVPVQVPLVVVSVEPTLRSPLITGGTVFTGTVRLAAWPLLATPKTDPIASEARARSRAAGQRRRPKEGMRVIPTSPLSGGFAGRSGTGRGGGTG